MSRIKLFLGWLNLSYVFIFCGKVEFSIGAAALRLICIWEWKEKKSWIKNNGLARLP